MLNVVQIVDGNAVTTSRKVAEVFEKQHKDVLRAIRELEMPEDFGQRNFAPSEYEATNNLGKTVKYPEYLITKDGFSLLVMGFTGKKAMEFKIAFINAFNTMEEELKRQTLSCRRPANIAATTAELIEKINLQLIAGMEVEPEILRYAWNIGRLVGKTMPNLCRTKLKSLLWDLPAANTAGAKSMICTGQVSEIRKAHVVSGRWAVRSAPAMKSKMPGHGM